MDKKNLAVIFGGMSTEHDVSIVSGTSVIHSLNKEKYNIFPIYISKEGNWFKYIKKVEDIGILEIGDKPEELQEIENPFKFLKEMDVVFPVLHGLYGEDGTIQGLLELINVPYVGCKVLGSSICMDKVYTKAILEKAKIKQANYIYIRKNKDKYIYVDKEFNEQTMLLEKICDNISKKIQFPMFVKPSNFGSSVGIKKARDIESLKEAIKFAANYDNKILIEQGIDAIEVECAILGNEEVEASCVGEIINIEDFYSYDEKYKNEKSEVLIPANISDKEADFIRKMAIKAYKALDAKGLARVDFFIDKTTRDIYLNEINTMPGFTKISMYPKLWENCKMSYTVLLDKLIELAL